MRWMFAICIVDCLGSTSRAETIERSLLRLKKTSQAEEANSSTKWGITRGRKLCCEVSSIKNSKGAECSW